MPTRERTLSLMSPADNVARVVIFGGTGFLGRHIAARVLEAGIDIRVAVRHPEAVPIGRGISAVAADVRNEAAVAAALQGCDAAINAVGHYVEKGAATFQAVHEVGAHNVARQARAQALKRLVHISGIGAVLNSPSHYVHSRARGEHLVRQAFPETVILRPSVMFAPDDHFVNAIARIARFTPVLPLFGSGRTRLQPVFVDDVANAALAALQRPETRGRTYELGGPDILSYRELIKRILLHARHRRLLLPVPFQAWALLAILCGPLPAPPITKAQVTLMRADNVVANDALVLAELGVAPTALDAVLPEYRM